MKKLFVFTLLMASLAVIFPPPAQAKANSAAITQRVEYIGPPQRERRWGRRPYSVIRTRIVRIGFRRYRETYRITYLPNGRTRVRVIRRVRIR